MKTNEMQRVNVVNAIQPGEYQESHSGPLTV